MGVDYQAAIVVGLPRGDFESHDLIDGEDLELCTPYYDGFDCKGAIAGFFYASSGVYKPSELAVDNDEIESLKARFKELTGLDAKVYLSPYGW